MMTNDLKIERLKAQARAKSRNGERTGQGISRKRSDFLHRSADPAGWLWI